jgi:autotransporter translocation and assembly factor TamB
LGIEGLWLEPDQPMEFHGVLNPIGLRRLGTLLPGAEGLPKGRVGAEIRVGGTPSQPRMTLASSLDVRLGDVPDRARVDLDVLLREGRFDVGVLVMQEGVRRLRVEGEAATRIETLLASLWDGTEDPPWGDLNAWVGALDLEVVPMAFPLSALSPFVPIPEGVEGFLGGGFQVGGTLAHPTLAGAMQVIEGRLGDLVLAPALVAVSPMEGAFKIMGLFGLDEGSLEFAGSVPFDFDADFDLDTTLQRDGLSLDIWGRGIPLGVLSLVDPAIRDARGRVAVSGHVGGSLLDPVPEIQLSLQNGHLDYPPLGIGMRELAFQVDTSADALRILKVSGGTRSLVGNKGKGGKLTAQGEFPFPWRGDAGMDIGIRLADLLLADLPELEVVLAGDLQFTGAWPTLTATGAIELLEANVMVDENVWLSQATMRLNPDLRIHRENVALDEGDRVPTQREWWEDLVVDVEVDLGNNTWGEALVPLDVTYGAVSSVFSTVAAKGRVRGQIRVKGTLEDALVEGQVETERATAVVFGTEFEVERGGVIRFTGTDYTNPEVDLTAVHQTTQYGDVSVDISGTLEALTLAFRSSVGLNEKDIAALLLLGRPTSELGEGEGSLVGAAVGAMAGRAESIGLGDWVDLFQLDTEGEAISAYTVGKAVGDKAFLSYSRDFYAEMDENQAELTLEVFFTRNVHAQVVAGDRGQSSADLFLRWRF